MKIFKTLSLLLLLALSSTFVGCGGTTTVEVPEAQVQTTGTLGQQLIDLYAAYQSGAIDEDKYEDLKESLLEKYED